MEIIIILILISLSIAIVFLGVFFWNMRSGQFDDTYTPSVRMLFDNKKEEEENVTKKVSRSTTKVSDQPA